MELAITKAANGMAGIATHGEMGKPGYVILDYVITRVGDEHHALLLRDDMPGEDRPRLRPELETQILTAHGLEPRIKV